MEYPLAESLIEVNLGVSYYEKTKTKDWYK